MVEGVVSLRGVIDGLAGETGNELVDIAYTLNRTKSLAITGCG
jgi:hypothetical protein